MFSNIYNGKKILITGNTGFKGSWLSAWLLKLGANIIGISNNIPSNPSMYEVLHLNKSIKSFDYDIRDIDSLSRIIKREKPDFVFHLAAQSLVSISYIDPIETITTNILGTANILEVLRQLNNSCVAVIITSDKCYDNVEWFWGYKETDKIGGKDIYSGSKGSAELIFKSYYNSFFIKEDFNCNIATARAGNVIGGGDWAKDRIVPDCMRAWSNNNIVDIRSPKATRPWQHVLEPLSGYLNLAQNLYQSKQLNGHSFNFGPLPEHNYTVEEIIKNLSLHWGLKNSEEAFKIIGENKFHEAGLLKLNCDKASYYLDWMPTLNFEELMEFTGSWYFKYYNDTDKIQDFTLEQINIYEKLAIKKKLKWTS